MLTQIKNDIKEAMRNKDKEKLSTLRMLLATIETERGKNGLATIEDFSDDEIIGLINRNIKALNSEIESLIVANRDSSKQEKEKELLVSYLPTQMMEDEIRSFVAREIEGARAMLSEVKLGQVMGSLSSKLKGKADMGLVSKVAKELF